MFLDLVTVLHGLFISLGVGASTLAIVNFFVAIWDGKIDPNERRMMGVVYVILRIAMVSILLTTSILAFTGYEIGLQLNIVWTLIAILFLNAILMTLHKLPSAFGPAIQASAWYTLGILSTIRLTDWEFSYVQFILFYGVLVTVATTIINLLIMYIKDKNSA